MTHNTSSRRRQFSDVRSQLNASCGSLTNLQSHTPTKNALNKPGKWKIGKQQRAFESSRHHFKESSNMNSSMRVLPKEVEHPPIHSHKAREFCVNCLNKLMADKKKKQKVEREKKQQQIEKQNIQKQKQYWEQIQRQEVSKVQKEKQFLGQTVVNNKSERQKVYLQKEKEVQLLKMRHIEQEIREQHQKEIERELKKRQKFNQELRDQIEDQRRRKREQQEIERRAPQISFQREELPTALEANVKRYLHEQYKKGLDQQIRLKQKRTREEERLRVSAPVAGFDRDEAPRAFGASIKGLIQGQYKKKLDEQIRDKQEKQKRQREQQRKADEYNNRVVNEAFQTFQPQPQVVINERAYAEQLKRQIQTKRQLKQKQYQDDIKKEQRYYVEFERAWKQEAVKERQMKGRAVENYLQQLNNQMQMNRKRRVKQSELERSYKVIQLPQQKKEQTLEDCYNCHHRFPKKYLSIVDVD